MAIPDESREPNAVGVSVFYFTEIAEDEASALAQAKEKFNHSVYESDVQLESEGGIILPDETVYIPHQPTASERLYLQQIGRGIRP